MNGLRNKLCRSGSSLVLQICVIEHRKVYLIYFKEIINRRIILQPQHKPSFFMDSFFILCTSPILHWVEECGLCSIILTIYIHGTILLFVVLQQPMSVTYNYFFLSNIKYTKENNNMNIDMENHK